MLTDGTCLKGLYNPTFVTKEARTRRPKILVPSVFHSPSTSSSDEVTYQELALYLFFFFLHRESEFKVSFSSLFLAWSFFFSPQKLFIVEVSSENRTLMFQKLSVSFHHKFKFFEKD